jgi:hypothetical protein
VRRTAAPESESWTLSNLELKLESPGQKWTVRVPTPGAGEQDALSLVRLRDSGQTTWLVDCGAAGIPAWVAAGFCDPLHSINGDAVVSGRMELYQQSESWSGRLSGVRVKDLDLADVVMRRFGHMLTGRATVDIQSATITDGRLSDVEGTLVASDGTVGKSFLAACEECAEMILPWAPEDHRFARMQFGFRLHDYGVAFVALDGDAIITSADGRKLLIPRSGYMLPQARLLALLTWPFHESSPVNRNTAALAARLAWPPVPAKWNPVLPDGQTAELDSIGQPVFR